MYSFLIVAFSGIDLALLTQASCLDLILFMNLVALSVVLLAFASTFCNEVHLFPKRGLPKSIDGFLLLSLYRDANLVKCDCELDLSLLLLLLGIL
jgi:hypothetical protein